MKIFKLLMLCALTGACSKSKIFAVPPLQDAPVASEAQRVSMAAQIPAYGIAIFNANARIFTVNIEAGDASRVRLSQSAMVYFDSEKPVSTTHVTRLLKNASQETGQSIAWLQAEGESRIPAGEFVFAKIQVGKRPGVMAVPQKSIFIRDAKTWVITPVKNSGQESGKAKYAPVEVELGEQSGDQIEIKAGLKLGDPILVDGGLGYLYPDFKSQAEGD